ncbi:hypothetical protein SOVF_034020 [Spinacia oleracea]|nr:hypothetical protein SOVF_034020 [Spinacia oleracea]
MSGDHIGSDKRHFVDPNKSRPSILKHAEGESGRVGKASTSAHSDDPRCGDDVNSWNCAKMVDGPIEEATLTDGNPMGTSVPIGSGKRTSSRKKGDINYRHMANGSSIRRNKQCKVVSIGKGSQTNSDFLCLGDQERIQQSDVWAKNKIEQSGDVQSIPIENGSIGQKCLVRGEEGNVKTSTTPIKNVSTPLER